MSRRIYRKALRALALHPTMMGSLGSLDWRSLLPNASESGSGDEEAASPPIPAETPSILQSAQGHGSRLFDRARAVTGLQPTRRDEAIERVCGGMSMRHRLFAFAVCFVLGWTLSIASFTSFSRLVSGNPTPFAVKYTIGNLISLASSAFLVGPAKQLRQMTHPTRWVSALVYVLAMFATLFCALKIERSNKKELAPTRHLVFAHICTHARDFSPHGTRHFFMYHTCVFILLNVTLPPHPNRTYYPRMSLVLLTCVVQFLSMGWYMLSYVPFGRRIASNCIRGAVSG